ncbi:MAG: hypothetical protein LBN95_12980 [Prevotellaceae bacterium]|jgi:hypothetical protein|nr:hypothetical protein [Prevotellaceae bacterium]
MQEKKYKAMYKSEIARAAGVSSRVFSRWLYNSITDLAQFDYKNSEKILSPAIVKFLCEKYVIILE